MFRVLHKVDASNVLDPETGAWLDEHFGMYRVEKDIRLRSSERGCSEYSRIWDQIRGWGDELRKGCPQTLWQSLFYLCASSDGFPYKNYLGRTLPQTWTLFFERFPRGQVWLAKISRRWWHELWDGESHIAEDTGYAKEHAEEEFPCPQSASGLLAENFPLASLNILAFGIYPLILCDHISILGDLVCIYVPDQAFKYSVMREGKTRYQRTLWKVHHVFDDQLTFNSSRGPKSAVSETVLNPIDNLAYFDWFIRRISDRMLDLVRIADPFEREQFGMTINRAICDAQLCATSELPYMTKVFFFGCLDKLANLMLLLDPGNDEVDAWRRLVDRRFLSTEVLNTLKSVPGRAGEYLRWVVERAVEEMRVENLSSQDLRDIRNSRHGYKLHQATFDRLMRRSGEFNNDITLIATPLILYFLSKNWTMAACGDEQDG